jgi:hypothetical protein
MDVRRDLAFVVLAVPLAAVAVGLLATVDFAHQPRKEAIGGDVGVTREGCLDWWCRADDIVPVGIAAVLLGATVIALVWGLRRR